MCEGGVGMGGEIRAAHTESHPVLDEVCFSGGRRTTAMLTAVAAARCVLVVWLRRVDDEA